ncbi:unnamed protein product [Pedinophyceae sp. YPF-701]|nr:unnamed protein product [Pedinophyceae sp. YPF-701]
MSAVVVFSVALLLAAGSVRGDASYDPRDPDICKGALAGNLLQVEWAINVGKQDVNYRFCGTSPHMPIHGAAETGNLEIVRYLVENGADVNALDNDDETALHEAAEDGHLEVVKYLIAVGVDPDIRNDDGETAADIALARGYPEVHAYLRGQVERGPRRLTM